MSFDNFFLILGLVLLAVVGIRKISGKVALSPRSRGILAACGVCFAIAGVLRHHWHIAATSPLPNNARASRSEVHAQEMAPGRHVPVAPAASELHSVGLSYFAGRWKNTDQHTRGLSKIDVRTAGESVWVRAWGACHPIDCEWGEVAGVPSSRGADSNPANETEKLTALFETSFSNTVLTLSPADDDELQADTQTHFTDNSGRSGYSATYTFRH